MMKLFVPSLYAVASDASLCHFYQDVIAPVTDTFCISHTGFAELQASIIQPRFLKSFIPTIVNVPTIGD